MENIKEKVKKNINKAVDTDTKEMAKKVDYKKLFL
jgi:hypothetical protein